MRMVICSECGEMRQHLAKGMCSKCYHKDYYKTYKDRRAVYYKTNKERIAKYKQTHRKANADIYFIRDKAYREANKEKIAECKKAYWEVNKEKIAERRRPYNKKWTRENRDKKQVSYNNYIARKANNGGTYTIQEWAQLLDDTGHICLACGKPESECALTVDHIIPVSCGGTSYITNLQPLCKSCNSSKGAKEIDYRMATHV